MERGEIIRRSQKMSVICSGDRNRPPRFLIAGRSYTMLLHADFPWPNCPHGTTGGRMTKVAQKGERRSGSPLTLLTLCSGYARVARRPPQPVFIVEFARRLGLQLDLRVNLPLSEFEPAVFKTRVRAPLLFFTWDQPIGELAAL